VIPLETGKKQSSVFLVNNKRKAYFGKTMDDRSIIKQIKKTELVIIYSICP